MKFQLAFAVLVVAFNRGIVDGSELRSMVRVLHHQLPEMPDEVSDVVPDMGEPMNHTHPDANYEHEMVKIPLKIPLVWESDSELDVTAEAFLAFSYILLLGSVPMVLAMMEPERTRVQMVQAICLFIWLLGGLWLFTCKLKFTSGHFDTDRSLTVVETIYLFSQIITTVGYGDICPAFPRGQVFIGFYVLAALFVIADMVTEVANLLIERAKALAKTAALRAVTVVEGSASEDSSADQAKTWVTNRKAELPTYQLLGNLCVFVFFVVIGFLFYHHYEDKQLMESVYMSVITLSTVGFGAITADTEIGKVFGAFWMLFGVCALAGVVGSFAQYMMARKELEMYSTSADIEEFNETCNSLDISVDDAAVMTKAQFLQLAVVHTKMVDLEVLQSIERSFQSLKPDKSGTVSFKQLADMWGQELENEKQEQSK